MRLVALTLIAVLLGAVAPGAQTVFEKQTMFEVERELQRLPTYGVFDQLSFSEEKGTVTLMGSAYSGALKSHAANAIKRVPGVDTVDNRIEVLPASMNDDRIRWETFYRIYSDDFLSRYAPGGAMSARYELYQSQRFPGMQPFGAYPIHIIVKNGRTTLVGVVDNAVDKRMAEFRARDVSGVFAVANELTVESD